MKAVILDGSHADDRTAGRVRALLLAALQRRGWVVEPIVLRERKIGNCAGDFFCWIRTPGTCNVNDDNRAIAATLVNSDLMVYLTPVTFGGYSSALKRMVDHQIQNISPFFTTVGGETHHQKRYPRYPDFLAVGWLEAPDPHAEAVFGHLVQRNAINFHAEKSASGVVTADRSDAGIGESLETLLDELRDGRHFGPVELPVTAEAAVDGPGPRRALLLVGSPRTKKSTSNALGAYLLEQLAGRGIETATAFVYTSHGPGKMEALLDAVDHADLLVLAFPLYVDTLSAPVIELLERMAARRQATPPAPPQRFAVLTNCGFPEARHTANAVAVCETFARQAGFVWAGALALGGGHGLVNGTPLVRLGGRGARVRKAIDIAADALAQGGAIPSDARSLIAKPVIPAWLYRLLGQRGWRQWAGQYDAAKLLDRQPYRAEPGGPDPGREAGTTMSNTFSAGNDEP